MVETVSGRPGDEGISAAARLLHDFNLEYDEPAPAPDVLATRLAGLVADGHVTVLLARHGDGTPVGVAVMRVQPAIVGLAQEMYLAELYVVPGRRGQGYGRGLITEAMRVARAGLGLRVCHHRRGRPACPAPLRGGRIPPYRRRARAGHARLR